MSIGSKVVKGMFGKAVKKGEKALLTDTGMMVRKNKSLEKEVFNHLMDFSDQVGGLARGDKKGAIDYVMGERPIGRLTEKGFLLKKNNDKKTWKSMFDKVWEDYHSYMKD